MNAPTSLKNWFGKFSRHIKGYSSNRTKKGKNKSMIRPSGNIHADMTLPAGYQEKLATRLRAEHRAYDADGFKSRAQSKRNRKAA